MSALPIPILPEPDRTRPRSRPRDPRPITSRRAWSTNSSTARACSFMNGSRASFARAPTRWKARPSTSASMRVRPNCRRRGDRADEKIHARSVTLSSERLRVIAKLDLVEAEGTSATPVDYKHGAPREGKDGIEMWPADRAQIALQAIVLRENGYRVR